MTTKTPNQPITVVEDEGLTPLCPYCEATITTIRAKRLHASGAPTLRFGKRYLYACPSCNKSLGITHRKGFWMG